MLYLGHGVEMSLFITRRYLSNSQITPDCSIVIDISEGCLKINSLKTLWTFINIGFEVIVHERPLGEGGVSVSSGIKSQRVELH